MQSSRYWARGTASLGAVAGLGNAAVYRFCLLLSAMVALSGCSVGMALSGDENPDLSAIKVGATRGEVEMHLGSPVRSSSGENGTRTDIYEYEIGNEPSAGRAVAHGFADVLTLGLWEIAGTPIEAVQGETYEATVIYDERDRVAEIKTRKTGS